MTAFRLLSVCLALLMSAALSPARASDDYTLGPDSLPQPGVPKGEVTHYTWKSKVFPGTERDYWVYVPKQYDAAKPACVMIFQDGGGGLNVPVVFDNLISKKEMPVTVAIMITPGVLPASEKNALPRYNRSFEYDAPTDQYARFLLEEILPEVGKKVNLSQNPNDRGLCGASSGGICAFTAAWERPDQFRRVISFVGSFTNLRGGHVYPSLIRKMEPKPLRVFMQDGSNDQDIYSGSWFIGNNDVAAALRFAGCDVKYVVGDGGHNGKHGASIMPDALRWLWRNYPEPIRPPASTAQPVLQVALTAEPWQPVSGEVTTIGGLAADAAGNVYYTDRVNSRLYKIGADGKATVFKENTAGAGAIAFRPDGRLYAAQSGKKRIVAYDPAGKETVIANGTAANSLVCNHKGELFLTDAKDGKIWRMGRDGRKDLADAGIPGATGIQLTPDQTLLLVNSAVPGKFCQSYQVQPDGSLTQSVTFFDLYIPFGQLVSGAGGMVTDTQGRLYVASIGGIQLCDQAGRVIGIIANPGRLPSSQVVFGGPNLDTLYVAAGGKVYRRKTKAKGVLPFQEPIRPPAPIL